MPRLVEVVFPLPLDLTFTYDAPESAGPIEIGQRVLAPFQRRRMTGFVVGFPAAAGEFELKSIDAVLDPIPVLTPELLSLARRMAHVYGISIGEAVQTVLPPGLIRQSRRRILALKQEGDPKDETDRCWLARIRKSKGLDLVAVLRRNPEAAGILRSLERQGYVSIETVLRTERARVKKGPLPGVDAAFVTAPEVKLTAEQKAALAWIGESLGAGEFRHLLLHGITGSGKTEVYLQAAAKTLESGRNVLALVPEIALTPQFLGRFTARFGDRIALLHSARSESERLTEWMRIRKGEARIVIGARSALFAPLSKIGLIVVDEEHDSSYKQHEGVLYHARDLAKCRAQAERAVLVFGSATPSLETYQACAEEKIVRMDLPTRVTGQGLARVEVVDLRETHVQSGKKGIFSPDLLERLTETLGHDEQAVLFLNRRGWAPTLLCPACGSSLRCPDCSVSFTYHRQEGVLLCHYCGRTEAHGKSCGVCGNKALIPLGIGTERVEEDLHRHFPDARIERMDRDSVRRRGEHERILKALATGKADILIGTQMVTKGLDVPNVTLVGVLLADQGLHFPDFRAAERTFQLLTQVVGRSGRGKKEGRAVVQTFQPDHYAIRAAAAQDYQAFFEQEIAFRRELLYPPFRTFSLLEVSGEKKPAVRRAAEWMSTQARKNADPLALDVLGPAPAAVERVEGRTRYQLFIRGPIGGEGGAFTRWLYLQAKEALAGQDLEFKLDLDPQTLV